MKVGLLLGYSGKTLAPPMDLILGAEKLGYDSVWIAEAYGSDAVTVAAWILGQTKTLKVGTAIMQVPARTPANTAMTAMSLSQMSGGRSQCIRAIVREACRSRHHASLQLPADRKRPVQE